MKNKIMRLDISRVNVWVLFNYMEQYPVMVFATRQGAMDALKKTMPHPFCVKEENTYTIYESEDAARNDASSPMYDLIMMRVKA